MDGWNTTGSFLLERPSFRGYNIFSGRVSITRFSRIHQLPRCQAGHQLWRCQYARGPVVALWLKTWQSGIHWSMLVFVSFCYGSTGWSWRGLRPPYRSNGPCGWERSFVRLLDSGRHLRGYAPVYLDMRDMITAGPLGAMIPKLFPPGSRNTPLPKGPYVKDLFAANAP